MTPPAPDCTCRELEKGKVLPNGDSGDPAVLADKVTGAGGLQSANLRISSALTKIIVLF
jgi:hypothetical protein